MKYRITCLTPTLVGDGQRLSPIDYMVWKDYVNILDQNRIFRLLAKGPRLESYLVQLKKADKLDFGSWGGFAQNFAGRRIPFEHASSTQYYERARAENLFIPTFANGPNGPYLPGTAVKGALRTGFSDKLPLVAASDSAPVPISSFKIYLLRVSTLGGWKQSPRGTVRRAEEGTPIFAEMASPGVVFEGNWHEKAAFNSPAMFESVNAHTDKLLQIQENYAERTGLEILKTTLDELKNRLNQVREANRGCLFPLGWGGGFLSKTKRLNTEDEAYRQILRQEPLYARAIQSGLPFPKTRKIVFLGNQPATLPGFVHLEAH